MVGNYVTVQGDTFDQIARAVFGNERRMDALLEENPEHMATVVFSAGAVLRVPDLPAGNAASATAPPWSDVK